VVYLHRALERGKKFSLKARKAHFWTSIMHVSLRHFLKYDRWRRVHRHGRTAASEDRVVGVMKRIRRGRRGALPTEDQQFTGRLHKLDVSLELRPAASDAAAGSTS